MNNEISWKISSLKAANIQLKETIDSNNQRFKQDRIRVSYYTSKSEVSKHDLESMASLAESIFQNIELSISAHEQLRENYNKIAELEKDI